MCDHKMLIKLEEKIYDSVIKLILLCGTECWIRLGINTQKVSNLKDKPFYPRPKKKKKKI